MALRFSPSRGSAAIVLNAAVRGPQGAAATVTVGATLTSNEGADALVTNSGTTSAAILNFSIPRGAVPAVGYNFDVSTTDADPGDGDMRFNSATLATVTAMYFDNLDRGGNTVTTWLDSFDDSTTTAKGKIVVTPAGTPSAQLIYAVTGSVVDGTGYRKVTVSYISGTTLPSSTDHLAFQFIPTGDRGANPGFRQTYSATTGDADPGPGVFRLNNATIASATAAYMDNLDYGGTTISGVMDLWDDSTNTVKGTLRFVNQDDPTNWAMFQITGSVVDGTGYRKLTLSSGQSAGAFSGVYVVTFSRAGDKGADGANGVIGVSGTPTVSQFGVWTNATTQKGVSVSGLVKGNGASDPTAATAGTDFMKPDTTSNLTAGFTTTSFSAGTKSSGTFTPDAANGNVQHYVNGGAHTLAPQTASGTIVIECVNATAGALTTSGFTIVDGDTYSSSGTKKHIFYLTKTNSVSHLNVRYVTGT